MVGRKRNFVDKRDHYYFNAGSERFGIKKIEGNKKTNHVEWAAFEERTRSMQNRGKTNKASVLQNWEEIAIL